MILVLLYIFIPRLNIDNREDHKTDGLRPLAEFISPASGRMETLVASSTPCCKQVAHYRYKLHSVTGKCINCCIDCRHNEVSIYALDFSCAERNRRVDLQIKHLQEYHGLPVVSRTHKGNGSHKGCFAFTLTKSPSDNLTEADMLCAVGKIMSQKSNPVSKYRWYLEYGDKDNKVHPHIHGMYETESQGRIEAKHWKRSWPVWDEKTKQGVGFRGGYHRPVKDGEAYTDYIMKDGGPHGEYGLSDCNVESI